MAPLVPDQQDAARGFSSQAKGGAPAMGGIGGKSFQPDSYLRLSAEQVSGRRRRRRRRRGREGREEEEEEEEGGGGWETQSWRGAFITPQQLASCYTCGLTGLAGGVTRHSCWANTWTTGRRAIRHHHSRHVENVGNSDTKYVGADGEERDRDVNAGFRRRLEVIMSV